MKLALSICILVVNFVFAQEKLIGPSNRVNPYNYPIVKQKNFANAAVSSAHPLASMVGAEIMKQGGNAFDAAIAVQYTLAVVYPNAGNIGGGGFMVARKKDGKNLALDYRETAPLKSTKDMYLDSLGNAIEHLSKNGRLAAGVPGTIAGLFETHKHAKLSMATLIQPAIDLAEFGFTLTENEAASLNAHQKLFIENNSHTPAFVKETPWKVGDTLIQTDLANTLKRIRDNGQAGFYDGITAELITGEMGNNNGIISLEDLKNYKAVWRTNLSFNYKGYNIIGMSPPSSGGVIVWQLMKMIEKRNIGKMGFHSTKAVQLMVEAERRAYADRAKHLGDPDFYKVPITTLTSDSYIAKRMKDFDSTKATPSNNINAGEIKESEQTTHISIIDKENNMVSVTTTLNGSFGSHTVVAGAGFLLNNEMDDFSVKPGTPNMYGAIGGEANAIEPNKRMLSSMTPTIVIKDNKPAIVLGTPGGTTIPTSVFQTLVNIIEFKMSAADAVNKPKFHHQWLPDEIFVEQKMNNETRRSLQDMGYSIKERLAIGRTEVIKILANGLKEAAADFRGDDSVAGY